MRECQIQIGPFPFVSLQELRIEQEINELGKAWVTMRIKDEWKDSYMNTLLGETWIRIIGKGEDEDENDSLYMIMFCGLVTDFSFSMDGYETLFRLEAASGTVKMDMLTHFRVFQNAGSPCLKICKQLTESYTGGKVVCMEGNEANLEDIMIQYEETDWEFLKRVAQRAGLFLVSDTTGKGVSCTLGFPAGIQRIMPEDKIKIKWNIKEYMQKSANGIRTLQEIDMQELIISIREIWRIGDSVWYQGKKYFVWKISTEYNRIECIHTYYLRTKKAIQAVPVVYQGVSGYSFQAVVTDVEKDKVQIEIERDEWRAMDGKKWFLYATVYSSEDGTGWYCMPEIGDHVRLYKGRGYCHMA